MISFNLNISKLNDNIGSYKIARNNAKDQIEELIEYLKGNIDAGWEDENSITFIDILKKYSYKINERFEYYEEWIKKLDYFKEEIKALCVKYSFTENSKKIIFDESGINKCKEKLNGVITYLNNALYYINLCNFKSSFIYYEKVCNLKETISNIIKTINDIVTSLSNFKTSMCNLITNSEDFLKKIATTELNISPLEFDWKLVTPEVRKVVLADSKNFSSTSAKIKFNVNKDGSLQSNRVSNDNNEMNFEVKEKKRIDNSSSQGKQTEITMDSSENISVLSKDYENNDNKISLLNENKILMEESKYSKTNGSDIEILEINSNISKEREATPNKNNIDLKEMNNGFNLNVIQNKS